MTQAEKNTLDNIINNYLANKTDEELKDILNNLDGSLFEAVEEDKKRCDKFLGLAQNQEFLSDSAELVYNKVNDK